MCVCARVCKHGLPLNENWMQAISSAFELNRELAGPAYISAGSQSQKGEKDVTCSIFHFRVHRIPAQSQSVTGSLKTYAGIQKGRERENSYPALMKGLLT